MAKAPRPRDTNQLAKFIVDLATGQKENETPAQKAKGQQRGGQKGGPARAKSLTPKRRSEIAKLAAEARWKKG